MGVVPSISDALFDGGKPCKTAIATMSIVHMSKSQHKLHMHLLIPLQGTSKAKTQLNAKQNC